MILARDLNYGETIGLTMQLEAVSRLLEAYRRSILRT
ncbi:MAG: hypothetical protein AAF892_10415 [Cyanobacteria bacterium P01_D01_bin.71]